MDLESLISCPGEHCRGGSRACKTENSWQLPEGWQGTDFIVFRDAMQVFIDRQV